MDNKMHKEKLTTIIAHRGASFYAPENTSTSILLAIKMNPHYVETDVQRTKDNHLIIFHDPNLKRTTNVSEVFPQRIDDPVGSFTLSELRQLEIGSWFNNISPKWARNSFCKLQILTFNEFLDLMTNSSCGIFIETKTPSLYCGIEQQIVDELNIREKNNADIILQSFELESMKKFKKLISLPRMLLVNHFQTKKRPFRKFVEEAKGEVDGIGVAGYIGWPQNLKQIHKEGLTSHCFTINKPWQLRLLYMFGARQLVTDRCDLAMNLFHGYPKQDINVLLDELGY
ncbi:glycerophosphodiester phosphodiesterase family protein [Candidatus Uabimicrobium sp. HlEnr_7]|uniref:glycerophosphodiester phosphodiesterase family protein n=1 Tax=Candidatus Uabimicrobium helgolandensis TaxID=3095367 RepID=UPI0035568F97